MEKYDVVVIGAGSGMIVVWDALRAGLKVALVEKGPLGGTCLNNGCVPSKVMIYPADVVSILKNARAVGIEGSVNRVDFGLIMKRVRGIIQDSRKDMEDAIKSEKGLTWYREAAGFIGDYTLKAGRHTITAPKIVLATGGRPRIPDIPGLRESGHVDNITLLGLNELPESMIILGTGYIGCEYAHCFSALGTKVALIGRHPVVLERDDAEVSALVTRVLSRDLTFAGDQDVVRVERDGNRKAVITKDRKTGKISRFDADVLLVAAGRLSNADLLKPENSGIHTDKKGWIVVDKYLETTRPGIYALGDATGKHMFKHTANYEAHVVSDNLLKGKKRVNDTRAIPYAVFTNPQVGAVGMTEREAIRAGKNVLVGRAAYGDTAKGYAMGVENSLVKVVVDKDSNHILGCRVVGPEAPLIVQQAVLLMNTDLQSDEALERSQVIHPTLSEALAQAFSNLQSPSLLELGQAGAKF